MKLETVLGKTGLKVNKDGFGVLPIQRTPKAEAGKILFKALEGGINYFDTARAYTDSEEKIGASISERRQSFYLATKTHAANQKEFWEHLETSLKNLKTDYIDVYQLHNPSFCPRPGDESGLYDALLKAREQGKIRFIGITNHRLPVAIEAVESGLYDLLQFPFSYLADKKDEELVKLCAEKNVGFVAMKALSGGLITDIAAARSSLAPYANVVPIWGIQREYELDQLFEAIKAGEKLTEAQKAKIAQDREELVGDFCRGCGYCLPCPAEIDIPTCARMSLLLRRAPVQGFISPEGRGTMAKIDGCINCGHCKQHCPYGLDTPKLLQKNYEDFKRFTAQSA